MNEGLPNHESLSLWDEVSKLPSEFLGSLPQGDYRMTTEHYDDGIIVWANKYQKDEKKWTIYKDGSIEYEGKKPDNLINEQAGIMMKQLIKPGGHDYKSPMEAEAELREMIALYHARQF